MGYNIAVVGAVIHLGPEHASSMFGADLEQNAALMKGFDVKQEDWLLKAKSILMSVSLSIYLRPLTLITGYKLTKLNRKHETVLTCRLSRRRTTKTFGKKARPRATTTKGGRGCSFWTSAVSVFVILAVQTLNDFIVRRCLDQIPTQGFEMGAQEVADQRTGQ